MYIHTFWYTWAATGLFIGEHVLAFAQTRVLGEVWLSGSEEPQKIIGKNGSRLPYHVSYTSQKKTHL